MKTKLVLAAAALLCATFAPFASAAPVATTTTTTTQATPAFPATLPLGIGQLRKYALERVVVGNTSVYSQSIRSENGSTTNVSASGSSPKVILNALSSAGFSFKVTNPNDYCSFWTQLSDVNGQVMFYGGNGFLPEKVSTNNYRIPASAAAKLELSYSVPVYIDAVDYATVIFRDSAGNIQWTETLNAYNGYIYFPQVYASRAGEIVLYSGGYTTAYSLKDGLQIPDIFIKGNALVSFENYQEVNDLGLSAVQDLNVQSLMDISVTPWQQAPVVRVEISSSRKVSFNATVVKNGIVVEYAQVVSVHIAGQTGETAAPCQQGTGSFTLAPGVYWVSFNDLSTLQRYQPQPPYYGGGKG